MTSALQDFQQFVHWLHHPDIGASEDARRFANLVSENFPVVATSSRQRSQRSSVLSELARLSLTVTSPDEPVPQAAEARAGWAFRKLHHLTVGPFRGFRQPEPFELQKRIVMFYGPNGSGKTSLCEALEFALLGAVDEGDIKRIAADRYLSNSHEGRFARPVLLATDFEGRQVPVMADADAYRFCFVEKNRIDAFSRIAAKPAGQKTELIAALFGMDQFNDFVGHFNDSMEGQLTLVAVKNQELLAKQATLNQDNATVADEGAALIRHAQAEQNYANSYSPGMSYAQLLAAIGSPEHPGRLQELEQAINQPAPMIFGVSAAALVDAYSAAETAQRALNDLEGQLAQRSNDISFQDLYTAVLGLQQVVGDHCPACDTPLAGDYRALHNPYQKAHDGLAGLRELGELQARQRIAIATRNAASEALRIFLATFAQRVGATIQSPLPVQRYLADPGVDAQRAWWADGFQPDETGKSLAQRAVDWATELEARDVASRVILDDRQGLIDERDRLNQARIGVTTLANNRQQSLQSIADARSRIAAFAADNAPLIQQVAEEADAIARDTRIRNAYDQFLNLLRRYRTELPGTLMAGLNALTLELYNEFNVRDLDADKLSALYLPVTGEGRIELSFRGTPGARVDALQILSEGHVRCLGLSILLAKSLSIRAPLIVFDDAINAIDHEHRQGIREAIFESDRFAGTQIIVTCHSNEFIKDIQNHVPPEHWAAYAFRHHSGNYHPRVLGNATTQSYLLNARAAVERGDDRSALGASRQALEMLSGKIWGWLGRCDQGLLTLKIAGSGAEPALRHLCEGIRAKLRGAPNFEHADKAPIIQALDHILGIPEQSLVWVYLNKGTHEEANREDFDVGIVEQVVQTLESLSALQLRAR